MDTICEGLKLLQRQQLNYAGFAFYVFHKTESTGHCHESWRYAAYLTGAF
jgi:hypothetical protein